MGRRVRKRIIPFAYYVHIQEAIRSHSLHETTVLFVVSKVFEKTVNDKTNGDLEKCGLSSNFQYGSGLLVKFQIFQDLFLVKLLVLLTGQKLLKWKFLIYRRLLARFNMLIFFINSSLVEFFIWYLALFCQLSVRDGFEWFLVGNLC